MEISPTSNGSSSRPITHSKSSQDRQTNEQNQAAILENKAAEKSLQQRAAQEKVQQHKEESQRRLDGRLINFGQEESKAANSQKEASFNRSRINDAYSPPPNPNTASHKLRNEQSTQSEPIDIVV